MPRTPIAERVLAHYLVKRRKGPVSYQELLHAVFPPDKYPRAWRSAVQGGPPGCAIAFSAAVWRLGGRRETDKAAGTDFIWLPPSAFKKAPHE